MQVLEIEHITPRAAGGTDEEENLWLACRLCNNAKGVKTDGDDPVTGRRVRLFNPRTQRWRRHFYWSDDGVRLIGRTICGRATVEALNLNNEIALVVRQNCQRRMASPRSELASASLLPNSVRSARKRQLNEKEKTNVKFYEARRNKGNGSRKRGARGDWYEFAEYRR